MAGVSGGCVSTGLFCVGLIGPLSAENASSLSSHTISSYAIVSREKIAASPCYPRFLCNWRRISAAARRSSMGSRRLQSVTVIFLAVTAALFAPFPGASQRRQPLDYAQLFDKTEVMIPVRDGVKLHTEIYAPKNSREPLPILFDRTPYGISGGENGFSPILNRYADLIP